MFQNVYSGTPLGTRVAEVVPTPSSGVESQWYPNVEKAQRVIDLADAIDRAAGGEA